MQRIQDIFPSIVGSLNTPRSKEAIESVAKTNETQDRILDLNRKLTAGPCAFKVDDIAWLLEVAYAATEWIWWERSKVDIREELHQEAIGAIERTAGEGEQVLRASQEPIPQWLLAKIEEQEGE